MQEQLQKRLQSLKAEYEAGQQVLANLEAKKAGLRETLIRIGGAIQVLEEELAINQSGNAQPIEVLAKEDN
jgi:predicted nuclease with TOPRIM domain